MPVSFSAKSLVPRIGLRWLRQHGNNPHPWPQGLAERWDYNPIEDHETGDIRSLGLLHVIRDLVPYTSWCKDRKPGGTTGFRHPERESIGADGGSTVGREANGANPAGDRAERHYR